MCHKFFKLAIEQQAIRTKVDIDATSMKTTLTSIVPTALSAYMTRLVEAFEVVQIVEDCAIQPTESLLLEQDQQREMEAAAAFGPDCYVHYDRDCLHHYLRSRSAGEPGEGERDLLETSFRHLDVPVEMEYSSMEQAIESSEDAWVSPTPSKGVVRPKEDSPCSVLYLSPRSARWSTRPSLVRQTNKPC